MAIACLGFVTFFPLLPERSFPRLNSCISSFTFFPAFGLYRRLLLALVDFLAVVLRLFAAVLRPPEDEEDELFLDVFFVAIRFSLLVNQTRFENKQVARLAPASCIKSYLRESNR